MADTRRLSVLSDQKLIQMSKQFFGVDKDLVLRELRRRLNNGALKVDLPQNLRQTIKGMRGRV